MAELHPHEDALVRNFLPHDRRLAFLRGLSGRAKIRNRTLSDFCHFYDWVPGVALRLPAGEQKPGAIYQLLRSKGAPNACHVMGTDVDGQDVELSVAIRIVFDEADCAILSCIPGKLAFYQGEYEEERYILQR